MKTVRRHRRAAFAAIVAATAACGVGLIPLFPGQLCAGVRRDDTSDSLYTDLGNDPKYIAVGAITWSGFIASATMISPKWVLTAAHTTDTAGVHTFSIGGTRYDNGTFSITDSNHFANPNYTGDLTTGQDSGLIRLSTAVTTIRPATRLFDATANELGRTGTTVGYGNQGVGSTGEVLGSYGTKRAVQNVIDVLGDDPSLNWSNRIFVSDFDQPGNTSASHFGSSTPLTLEGAVAHGDSGGGTFVDVNGRSYLTGISSFLDNYDASPNGSYSDLYGSTRVSVLNQSFVDSNIVNYWNGSASGSFTDPSQWTLPNGGSPININPSDWDLAGVKTSGNYTISLPADVNNHQFLAQLGNTTINLSGHTYQLTSTMYEGGLVIGRYGTGTINNASVSFVSGTVSAHDAVIAQLPGSIGQLTIGAGATVNLTADTTPGQALPVSGDLYVGGSNYGSGGSGRVTIQSGTSTLNVAGNLRVYGTGTVNYNAGTLSASTLDIRTGGKVLLTSGANKVLQTKSVAIAIGGKLDLADNDMIVNYDGATPATSIKGFIKRGYNNGAWNGDGITTSNGSNLLRLGYGEASSLSLSSFDGIGVDSTSVLVKYTYGGDANLDGKVDQNDLGLLAQSWTAGTGLWTNGDFNYDGRVDVGDLLAIAQNWMAGVLSPLSSPISFSMALTSFDLPSLTAVPEPTSVGLLAICLGAFASRRRRRLQ